MIKIKVYSFDRKSSVDVVLENIDEEKYRSIQKELAEEIKRSVVIAFQQ